MHDYVGSFGITLLGCTATHLFAFLFGALCSAFLCHAWLDVLQEVLLGTNHGARAGHSQPTDGLRGSPPVVLHQVERLQRPRPPEPRLAVDGERAALRVLVLAHLDEPLDDRIGRVAAVGKVPV